MHNTKYSPVIIKEFAVKATASVLVLGLLLVIQACTPRVSPTPASTGTFTIPASTTSLPNSVVNGPLPGCVDAFELVSQTLALPPTHLTLNPGEFVDRVGLVTTGAVYTFSTRPVNPTNCAPTTMPTSPATIITFGFNYLGDFSRLNPVCINGSKLDLTGFVITGTIADAFVEPIAKPAIWTRIDFAVAAREEGIVNTRTLPALANPRCAGWVAF